MSPGDVGDAATQRVCCLELCTNHLGPLRHLSSNALGGIFNCSVVVCCSIWLADDVWVLQPFESTAARELFEFQVIGLDFSVLINADFDLFHAEHGVYSAQGMCDSAEHQHCLHHQF